MKDIFYLIREGDLRYYEHEHDEEWGKSGAVVGKGGWNGFSKLTTDGEGGVYCVNGSEIRWYKDQGFGVENWAHGSGNAIGKGGWDLFTQLTCGGNGVLYVVRDGNLIWYKDNSRNGTENWAHGSGSVIGRGGWDQFSIVTASKDNDGVIFAVEKTGNIRWYKYTGHDGHEAWAPGSGNVIGKGGWDQFSRVHAGKNGHLYCIHGADCKLYKHEGNEHEHWGHGSGKVIGHGGWNLFSMVHS